jgi:membrane-associated phospholipid phosphatase
VTTSPVRAWRTVFLGSAAAVLALTGAVLRWGVLPGEAALREAILAAASPGFAPVARWLSYGGRWPVLATGTVALLALCRGGRRRWWLWGAVLILAPLLGEAWQELVGRPRPTSAALGFPSGHATAVATFSVVALYLAGDARFGPGWRLALRILVMLAMLAVGLARVVVGAHWPGDVLVGFALGSACAAAAAWWDAARSPHPVVHRTGDLAMRYLLLAVVALALVVAACTQPSPPPRPLVVASFYPLYEFSRQVAGDRAEVVSLVPPGVEPHDWEPSPRMWLSSRRPGSSCTTAPASSPGSSGS